MKKLYLLFFILLLAFSIGILYKYSHKKKLNYAKIKLSKPENTETCFLEGYIQGNSIKLKLDTGASSQINLQKNTINKIPKKKFLKNSEWVDVHGNKYSSSQYLVSEINLGGKITFSNVIIQEEHEDFIKKNSFIIPVDSIDNPKIKEELENEIGILGFSCVSQLKYCLIDYKNHSFYIIKSLDEFMKESKISIQDFVACKMKPSNKFLLIEISTSYGVKTFLIDTAAEKTLLTPFNNKFKSHQVIQTKKFEINGYEYGPTNLYLFPIAKPFQCDGFLGLDFLKKGPFILDFKNKVVYFSKSEINALKLEKN